MRLVYVSPGPLDVKAIDGLSQFAVTWPGDVIAVQPRTAPAAKHAEPAGLHITTVDAHSIGSIRALSPDVILALHKPEYAWLTGIAPTVFTAEFTRRIRTDQQLVTARTALDRFRIRIGQGRRELQYRALAKAAAGLQCNGHAAWDEYSSLGKSAIRFRDHRIRESDIALTRQRRHWNGTRPLRVAFSGRLTAVKGPGTVLDVAALLPEVMFTILGDGDQRPELEVRAPRNVQFAGYMPFDEWKPFMRAEVDVALLPYPQGDPSCTYYEALGCGVPVVGLTNSTWRRVVAEDGFGWAEDDTNALVARLRGLTPHDLDHVRDLALDALEPFETVASRRVAHLVDVATDAATVKEPM